MINSGTEGTKNTNPNQEKSPSRV